MRVLMQGRADLYRLPGGDTTQLDRTAEAVRRLGPAVEVSLDPEAGLSGYDLVHVFSSTDDPTVCRQGMNARRQGVPLAVSTIYWNIVELLGVRTQYGRFGILYRLLGRRLTTRLRGALWRGLPSYRRLRLLFSAAGLLLPNSRQEGELARRDFGLPADSLIIPVVNAVDEERFHRLPDPELFQRKYLAGDRRPFALCVGRIEIRKNQNTLLRAAARAGFPLVLIGMPNPKEPAYVAECERLMAQAEVRWERRIPEENLYSAYAAAGTHVLPSWYETTGLSSLEAGAAGCPLVCSRRGPVEEYFGDMASYCEPDDVDGLAGAVMHQIGAPRQSRLRDHILHHFTWERCAEQTVAAYQRLLAAE